MKNEIISSSALDELIESFFDKYIRRHTSKNCRQKFSLDTTLPSDELPVKVSFFERKYKMMIGYLLILHYYPVEVSVRCYLLLDLQEHMETTNSFWLSVLSDKQLFLKWLEEQETITRNEFFSSICNDRVLDYLFTQIVLRFEEKLRKPKRSVWRKGYRDKGTLPDISEVARRKALAEDWYYQQLQVQIEERRLQKSALIASLRTHLSEGKMLTDEEKMLFRIIPMKGDYYGFQRKTEIEDFIEQRAAGEFRREDSETQKAEGSSQSKD